MKKLYEDYNPKTMTPDEFETYEKYIRSCVDHMIKGNANPYARSKYEDWVQEGWVAVLNNARKISRLPDLPLVSKLVHDAIVSKNKKDIRNDSHADYSEVEDGEGGGGSWAEDPYAELDIEDHAIIADLLSPFKEGSLERKYLEWWLEKSKIRDFGYHPPHKPRSKDQGYKDSYLATQVLGLPGTGSSRYKKLKRKMNDYIAKKLDFTPKEDDE